MRKANETSDTLESDFLSPKIIPLSNSPKSVTFPMNVQNGRFTSISEEYEPFIRKFHRGGGHSVLVAHCVQTPIYTRKSKIGRKPLQTPKDSFGGRKHLRSILALRAESLRY